MGSVLPDVCVSHRDSSLVWRFLVDAGLRSEMYSVLCRVWTALSTLLLMIRQGGASVRPCTYEDFYGVKHYYRCPRAEDTQEEIYCCGNEWHARCCEKLYSAEDLKYVDTIFGILALVFLIIVLLLVCCCCCMSCCILYRMHTKRQGRMNATFELGVIPVTIDVTNAPEDLVGPILTTIPPEPAEDSASVENTPTPTEPIHHAK